MKDLLENGRLVWRLVNDPRVPGWVKVGIPLSIILYFFSSIDFVPDILFGFGQLDDLGVILLGMNLIVRFSPPGVVEEHRRSLGGVSHGRSSASDEPSTDSGYWASPPPRKSGGRTRSIDAEYRVVPPGEGNQ